MPTKKANKTESLDGIFEVLNFITEANVPDSESNMIEMLKNIEMPENKINIMAAMLAGTAKKGMSGDLKSLEWIMEMLGLGQSKNQISGYYGIPGYLLGKAYVDVYRDIVERRHRFYDFKGGRGSLKSSFCALVMIDEIMRNEHFCGIALRQIKETLADSVYSQLIWAIDKLGFSEYFKCTVSPLQITRTDTGQIIYFRGGDEPVKIKSIKPPGDMYIGVIWFEEKDQLRGIEAVRNIQQSVMRGGDDIIVLSSYNTPISRRHFLNREEIQYKTAVDHSDNNIKQNRIIHHSFYHDSPAEWLGQPFLDEAEYLKEVNEKAYRHEYLGEAIGEGGNVFENVAARRFENDDYKKIENQERFYFGVDWGFYPDPWVFVKCCYIAKERRLYIIDEALAYKQSNHATAEILLKEKRLTKDDMILCDCSEPKSVTDYVNCGLYARGAEKGAGSVGYSMKWLQGLNEIVIDLQKCPNAAKEFMEYEYERDAAGEVISGYPDRNNHFIDAVRYATNLLWRRE